MRSTLPPSFEVKGKIAGSLCLWVGKAITLRVRGEWPISHPFEVKLLLADAKELPANARAQTGCEHFQAFRLADSLGGALLFNFDVQMMVPQCRAFVLAPTLTEPRCNLPAHEFHQCVPG